VGLRVREARGGARLAAARRLLGEYVRSLPIDLAFQGIAEELAGFPGEYARDGGSVWVALVGGRPAGCVAVRRLRGTVCEMKRLYVRPRFQGRGVGRALAVASLRAARAVGFRRMRLDTLSTMDAAIGLYRSLGFREIPAYRYNPVPGARYFELDLSRDVPRDVRRQGTPKPVATAARSHRVRRRRTRPTPLWARGRRPRRAP